jgi:hypothetical protein
MGGESQADKLAAKNLHQNEAEKHLFLLFSYVANSNRGRIYNTSLSP